MSDSADYSGDPRTVDVEIDTTKSSRHLRWPVPWRKRDRVELITDATQTPEENIRSRERTYMIVQGLRVPFILLSILAASYWHNWTLASVFFVVSIPLPWIAVMLGNGQGTKRDPRRKNVYKPAAARAEQHQLQHRQDLFHLEQQGNTALSPVKGRAIIDHDDQKRS